MWRDKKRINKIIDNFFVKLCNYSNLQLGIKNAIIAGQITYGVLNYKIQVLHG